MDALLLVLVGCAVAGAFLAAVAEALSPRELRHPLATGEDRVRQALRISGRFDRRAAMELRGRLLEDLRRHEAVRRHLEGGGATRDREVIALLELVDRSARATRHEIADVEMWLSRYR